VSRCNFDRGLILFILRQIFKNVGTRIETIVHIVFKFQVDSACFRGEEASTNFDGKVEKKKKERNNRSFVVIICMLERRHYTRDVQTTQ